MTPNKFQRLFLRQYQELHESKSRKAVLLIRILKSSVGSLLLATVAAVPLYSADPEAVRFFVPLAVGIILGNFATRLGDLMRRMAAWNVVEEITHWPKVYQLLDERAPDEKR